MTHLSSNRLVLNDNVNCNYIMIMSDSILTGPDGAVAMSSDNGLVGKTTTSSSFSLTFNEITTNNLLSSTQPSSERERERERNVLFNDALNTFYLRLYGVRHMVKDHSDSEKGNPLPPHRLLLSINSKDSFICTILDSEQH